MLALAAVNHTCIRPRTAQDAIARMSKLGTHQALNRLLTTIYRSLPMYLSTPAPGRIAATSEAVETLSHIVADQK